MSSSRACDAARVPVGGGRGGGDQIVLRGGFGDAWLGVLCLGIYSPRGGVLQGPRAMFNLGAERDVAPRWSDGITMKYAVQRAIKAP